MNKQVLFIHGGGDNGFGADALLVESLKKTLGERYEVNYTEMPSDNSLPDFGWLECIGNKIAELAGEIILVGHSLGASMLLKYLTEYKVDKAIGGIFLIATPYWSGKEEWVKGLTLREDFEDKLSIHIPIFLYHCRDDEEVSFQHLAIYSEKLPQATVRDIPSGGHQLNNDLKLVAADIKCL